MLYEALYGSRRRQVPDRSHQLADVPSQFERTPRRICLPEWHLPGLAGGRGDQHAIVGDFLDPPRRGAEQERLADAALEHHLLVEFSDPRLRPAFTHEEHTVKPTVGNRAAVDDGDALRAFTCGQPVLQAIPRESRPQVREVVGWISSREHVEDAFEYGPTELGERC